MKKILSLLLLLAAFMFVPSPASAAPGSEPRPPQTLDFDWSRAVKDVKPLPYKDKGLPSAPGQMKMLAPPTGVPVHRLYNVVSEPLASTDNGAVIDMTIAKPYLNNASDHHGVMELAVQDNSGNTIEVGTTVNPQVCPNIATQAGPCAFVFHWEGGNGQCYNVGCGFVPNPSADYAPGDELPNPNNSSGLNFRLVETATAWYAGLGVPTSPGYFMGYWLKTEWTEPGTDATAPLESPSLLQAFTETATTEPTATPCSDWGNGRLAVSSPPPAALPARIVNVKRLYSNGTSAAAVTPSWYNQPSTMPTNVGNVVPIPGSTDDFYVGGPGWKGNNTAPGSTGICG